MVTQRRSSDLPSSEGPTVEELREALASRDELIAVMGHELRNAMAPLVLLTEQFELMPTHDDLMTKQVAMLSRNLRRFRETVERVGEVSQLRTGKLLLEPTQLDAAEVIGEVCGKLASTAQASRCELRSTAASVTGSWDRERLSQIAQHLIGNAIRYASGAPIDITLDGVEGQLRLVVQDHGPGIPATERAGVFDRFERAGARRSGGLGVGLWVVRTLCAAMGGTVALLESEHGARFCVTLPRG
jgi:signal transduction histidine kinase